MHRGPRAALLRLLGHDLSVLDKCDKHLRRRQRAGGWPVAGDRGVLDGEFDSASDPAARDLHTSVSLGKLTT